MVSGLSAFPLTPIKAGAPDVDAFARLVRRLATAGVDSICALGSTGCYAYLDRAERARIARVAVENAGDIHVMVGIGAPALRDVLAMTEDAQAAGANAVLLAPVSYHRLSDSEVFSLYQAVTRELSVPLCVYDNPGTTNFSFSDELLGRIAQLPNIGSIKLPGVSASIDAAAARVERLRALLPQHVTIGVSGDASGATGLLAGCDVWYSVIGGLFPHTAMAISRAARAGDRDEALRLSARLQPLWSLFDAYDGSIRVIAAAAELMGLAESPCLPPPLTPADGAPRERLAELLNELALD